jgi:hypothetical protein
MRRIGMGDPIYLGGPQSPSVAVIGTFDTKSSQEKGRRE